MSPMHMGAVACVICAVWHEATVRNLRLVDPTLDLAQEFRAMAVEWRDASDERFADALRDFSGYVASLHAAAEGIGLPQGHVPYSIYWLVDVRNQVLGTSRLRHRLVPQLEKEGGHIGYDIRPSERRKGLGTVLLSLTLENARGRGIDEVVVTCDSDNVGSARVIEKNGGVLASRSVAHNGRLTSRYWIDLEGPGD